MRYADGPTAVVEVTVAAPAERVWPLVIDIQLPARFSDEFKGAEWLEGETGPRLGARFRGRNEHPAIGAWQSTSRVVACEPGQVFGWDVEAPDGRGRLVALRAPRPTAAAAACASGLAWVRRLRA